MFHRILPTLFWLVVIPALAGIYVGAAKLGLSLAPETSEQVTAVWPPTGIALAAVVLMGFRVWPAIAIGAFLANITTHEPLATACGIAAGNTLEAVMGGWLLLKVVRFNPSLTRLTDVLALIILAAGASTALAATVGGVSLCLGGAQPWDKFASLWGVWWLGDAMGDLIVAPLLLTWGADPRRPQRLIEGAVLLTLLLAVSWFGFSGPSIGSGGERAWAYGLFPLVTWAALRFGQRGTSIVTLVAASLAIWSTVHGLGPFGRGVIHDRLLSLQLFVGLVATSGLLLSAALAEREGLERELQLRLEQLKDADRRKDEFLATLAHELRNPLAPIQNALEILRLPGADPNTLAQAEEILGRQVQHLIRLVDDLLDMARISRGKIELRKERVALEAVVVRAIETARPLIDAKGHELTVALPPQPVALEADPTRLAQVISNLLNNAAKYSDPRGRIGLTAERDGDGVTIQVRDRGIGISREMLPHVFDLFVQAERARDRAHGGLGIGLTLVRQLVELHGGTVEATSDGVGLGSQFTLRLPLAAGDGPPSTRGAATFEQASSGDGAVSGTKVLIVDDNVDAARSLERLLASRGYIAHAVFDGAAALAWFVSHRPAAALLDIGMPEMDGYEVARRLRRLAGPNELLLIALTGWGQEDDRRRSTEAGFQAHLVKPVKLSEIEALLAQCPAVAAS